jgi:hypothetical protein
MPAPRTKLRQSPPFSIAAYAVTGANSTPVDDVAPLSARADAPFSARAANGGSGTGQRTGQRGSRGPILSRVCFATRALAVCGAPHTLLLTHFIESHPLAPFHLTSPRRSETWCESVCRFSFWLREPARPTAATLSCCYPTRRPRPPETLQDQSCCCRAAFKQPQSHRLHAPYQANRTEITTQGRCSPATTKQLTAGEPEP